MVIFLTIFHDVVVVVLTSFHDVMVIVLTIFCSKVFSQDFML
jgi:hypothetical protein